MIINSAPNDIAQLNQVDTLGEFKIRSSAKAFHILSSSLYANKIRAIVRELSTNALDSHVAAQKGHVPFDLHLPTVLEPWFAIRDYGVGLDDDQVLNIYTTYFESTKTASNDFVGCLGLGSKSPFSYSDNFTVTAVKDGVKRIYTAYLNEQRMPSIARMFQESTNDASGVEVRFAVTDTRDFPKFKHEAAIVLAYFETQPTVNLPEFKVAVADYGQKDLIPGVHVVKNMRTSVAVMGRIAYPIQIPNIEQHLGPLAPMLNCGLEMHFDIGQLDFQPSREGLSYIPMTIESIKQKLVELSQNLHLILRAKADSFTNEWEKALYIDGKLATTLWAPAAKKYVQDTKFDLINLNASKWDKRVKTWCWLASDLADQFNISISAFGASRNDVGTSTISPDQVKVDGLAQHQKAWKICISSSAYFAENDTPHGATERGRYHWRKNRHSVETAYSSVYIASPADRSKPMRFAEFMAAMRNPPRQCKVSSWDKKPRVNTKEAKNSTDPVAVLKLEFNSPWSSLSELTWKDSGVANQLDPSRTYYYFPLNNFSLESKYGNLDAKQVFSAAVRSGLFNEVERVYGVRKAEVDWVKQQKNWVNLEDHIVSRLQSTNSNLVASVAASSYINFNFEFSDSLVKMISDPTSEFLTVINLLKGASSISVVQHQITKLVSIYFKKDQPNLISQADALAKQVNTSVQKYPMLKLISGNITNRTEHVVADYINLVDRSKD